MADVAAAAPPPPHSQSLPPPQSQPTPEVPTLPHPQSSPIPVTSSPLAAATPPATNLNPTTSSTPPPPPPEPPTTNPKPNPKPEPTPIPIPSYSRWFSWNKIHGCEVKSLPEFFNGKSPSKNPRLYKYYRNSIIRRFRQCPFPPTSVSVSITHPLPKLTFTEARKTIVGDVGSIRRVFDFLEAWGLINYHGSPLSAKMQSKAEDKEGKATNNNEPGGGGGDGNAIKKRVCSSCNSVCTIACFSSLAKKDLTLCARCYVSGGVNSSDFTRVEIREDGKMDWTDKETLQLLEAVMHYGDDWKKVAERVVGRNEKDCINRFIKLPFGEQFLGPPESDEGNNFHSTKDEQDAESYPTKRVRLTPLADASNPIMAQAAFLSALVGVEVAEAAANAAVRALAEINSESEPNSGITTTNALEEASLQLEKEEKDLEKAVSNIAEVQAKEILDKIVHFEELDFQMEKEWQQVTQMQNLLFVDQLTLLFHKTDGPKTRDSTEEIVKPE